MRTPVETGRSIEVIVEAMNSIEIEEMDAMLKSLSRDEALGSMLDPTKWRDENMFDTTRKVRVALEAIKTFKKEVSGVGNFLKIEEQ